MLFVRIYSRIELIWLTPNARHPKRVRTNIALLGRKQTINYDDIWYATGFPDDYVVAEYASRRIDRMPIGIYVFT